MRKALAYSQDFYFPARFLDISMSKYLRDVVIMWYISTFTEIIERAHVRKFDNFAGEHTAISSVFL